MSFEIKKEIFIYKSTLNHVPNYLYLYKYKLYYQTAVREVTGSPPGYRTINEFLCLLFCLIVVVFNVFAQTH